MTKTFLHSEFKKFDKKWHGTLTMSDLQTLAKFIEQLEESAGIKDEIVTLTEHDRIRKERAEQCDRDNLESLQDAIRGLQSTDDPSLNGLHDELMARYRELTNNQLSTITININDAVKWMDENKQVPFAVQFTKTDGTERTMKCMTGYDSGTLIKNSKSDFKSKGLVGVWDMEKKEYRSFKIDSLKAISFDDGQTWIKLTKDGSAVKEEAK